MATKYPNEDNPHVAEIYRAMALRFYSRYLDARRGRVCRAHQGGAAWPVAVPPNDNDGDAA